MSKGIFEHRKTIVTIDDYHPNVIQPWTAIQRTAAMMGQSDVAEKTRVVYLPGIGWSIRPYNLDPSDLQLLSDAQGGILTSSDFTLANNHVQFNSFAKSTLDGVNYALGVQNLGSPFIQKRVPAGQSWEQKLAGDEGTYAPPFPEEDTEPLDRVAVTNADHEPWDILTFAFFVPAGVLESQAAIATFYFSGPASDDGGGTLGLGQYALKCRANGQADLYERLTNASWKSRFSFKWTQDVRATPRQCVYISVASDSFKVEIPDPEDPEAEPTIEWHGSKMAFYVMTITRPGFTLIETLVGIAESVLRQAAGQQPVYVVPKRTRALAVPSKIRVDCRRSARVAFQISKATFPASGVLFDDVITLDVPITMNDGVTACNPVFLWWEAIVPEGTTLTMSLYDGETGAALSEFDCMDCAPLVCSGGDGNFRFQAFEPAQARTRSLRVKAEFSSNGNRDKAPILKNYSIYCAAVSDSENPLTPIETPAQNLSPALPRRNIASLDLSPQEADPNTETGVVVINDMTNELTQLATRNMVPVKIETEYLDDEAQVQRATLFSGYAHTVEARQRRTRTGRVYPSRRWRTYTLNLVGEWARLAEALVPRRQIWMDPTSGEPMKITDVIRILLECAYPPSMVAVPDLPLRLFSVDSGALVMEPNTRVGEAAVGLAEDYLGAYLAFDEAAGTRGKWRLLEQKIPPYNNLAQFEIDRPAGLVLPHFSPAYGKTIDGDQVRVHTYITADGLTEWVEKAEGNAVVCYGSSVGVDAGKSGSLSASLLTQIAIKVDSYNFLGLPPDHEHFPDGSAPEYYGRCVPIKVFDYTLTTQEAVDWKTRRTYDRACWARKYLRFMAPMILVEDATDAEQQRPRKLRFYDPVLVRNFDGSLEQYLVVNCKPTFRKDHIQMAEYTLVTSGNIDTVGTLPRSQTAFESLMRAIVGRGMGGTPDRQYLSTQKAAFSSVAEIMGLPSPTSTPLQDLDPASPTFGEFYEMSGFYG